MQWESGRNAILGQQGRHVSNGQRMRRGRRQKKSTQQMQAYLEQQRPLQTWKVQKKPDPAAAQAWPPKVATANEFRIDEAP